jgi:putative protein-disulfide isomerase
MVTIQKEIKQENNHQIISAEMDRIEITYYTDPLCCWSWGFEPQWRRLQYEFRGMISWRYCMTGLIPSWNNYNDPLHSVTRPIQMGPVWMHASQLSGMPMHSRIWMEDPPASSYPACIAYKCADMQSKDAGETYLRLLREAVMIHGKNIAKGEVLKEIATSVFAKFKNGFDVEKFLSDLRSDTGIDAFRKDVTEVNSRNIVRTPTLILRHASNQAIMITGYRPYDVLMDAMKNLISNLKPVHPVIDIEDYKNFWGTLTEREITEAFH